MKKIHLLLLGASLCALPASGQFSNALHFDGGNDYVTSGLPGIFNNISAQNITIEAWIRPGSITFSRIFFAQLDENNHTNLALGNSGEIYFYVTAGGQIYSAVTSILAVTQNEWTHVAATWNAGTTTIQIYINGTLAASAFGGATSWGTNNTMTIGSRTNASQFFNGAIDELRIWSTLRTGAQIAAQKNAELTLPQAGLAVYYKFNQGVANGNNAAVTTLNDAMNGTNGALQGFALNGTASNWIANSLVLPLDWLELKGMVNAAQQAVLSWKVREQGVQYYAVEKSTDAKNFSRIATIASKGNGIQVYSFTDLNTNEAAGYYRIRQVDEDGRFTCSEVLTLRTGNTPGIKVYPNPATTQLRVATEDKGDFMICDMAGRLVLSAASSGNRPLLLDISALKPGTYFFRIGDKKGNFIKK